MAALEDRVLLAADAVDDYYTISPGGTLGPIQVMENDSPQGNIMFGGWTQTGMAPGLQLNSDGTFTFTHLTSGYITSPNDLTFQYSISSYTNSGDMYSYSTDTATVHIHVGSTTTNTGSAPTFTDDPYSWTIPQASLPGGWIGQLTATDADNSQETLYFSQVTTGTPFTVYPNGSVTTSGPLQAGTTYTLTVKVTDPSGLYDTTSVSITVTGTTSSGSAPSFTNAPYAFTASQAAPVGTLVGSLSATDPDANDSLTFSLVSPPASLPFQLNPNTGALSVASTLTAQQYSFGVRVTDSQGLSATSTVTVAVSPTNSDPITLQGTVNVPIGNQKITTFEYPLYQPDTSKVFVLDKTFDPYNDPFYYYYAMNGTYLTRYVASDGTVLWSRINSTYSSSPTYTFGPNPDGNSQTSLNYSYETFRYERSDGSAWTDGPATNSNQLTVTFRGASTSLSDYAATIDWGDGTTSAGTVEANGVSSVSAFGKARVVADHTFATVGQFDVQVTITGPGIYGTNASPNHGTTYTTEVVASVVAQTLSGAAPGIEAGQGVQFTGKVATFSDSASTGQVNQYSATISWGDGTATSAGAITRLADGTYEVRSSHTYADEGSYPLTVRVFKGGTSVLLSATASVSNVPRINATVGVPLGDTTLATFEYPLSQPDTTKVFTQDSTFDPYSDPNYYYYQMSGGEYLSRFIASDGSYLWMRSSTYSQFPTYVLGASPYSTSGALSFDYQQGRYQKSDNSAWTTGSQQVGASSQVSVTFRGEPTALTSYNATVNWGDMSNGLGTIVADGNSSVSGYGKARVVANHTFTAPGSFNVLVTVYGPGVYGSDASPSYGAAHTSSLPAVVVPANRPPETTPDTYTASHDRTVQGNVLANDSDPEGDPLSTTIRQLPSHGIVTLDSNGLFTYTPAIHFVGTDSFTYRAYDGNQWSSDTTVSFAITNNPPVAESVSLSVPHDATHSGDVSPSDFDTDGDLLLATLFASASNGTVSLSVDGHFTYTPNLGYVGQDAFSYILSDGLVSSSPATVSLSVGNTAPIANADSYTVRHDHQLQGNVLANDTDADGDHLIASVHSAPSNGVLVLSPNGSFTYTPSPGFAGIDIFTYYVNDGITDSSEVSVTIQMTNTATVARDDNYTLRHDRTLSVAVGTSSGIGGNDTNSDGDQLSYSLFATCLNGVLTMGTNGTFTYTPALHFVGTDSFVYFAFDGAETSNNATVTIEVTNDLPVTAADSASLPHDRSREIDVLANDTDADQLVVSISTQPTNGTATVLPSGRILYTPNPGYLGIDPFTYAVSDGIAISGDTTVTPNVVNRLPAVAPFQDAVEAGSAYTWRPFESLMDEDGDPLTLTTEGLEHATFTHDVHGTYTLAPEAGFTGLISFSVRVTDGIDLSDPVLIQIMASAQPFSRNDTYELWEPGQVLTFDPTLNDGSPFGDRLRVISISATNDGRLILNADGTLIYHTRPNDSESFTFTYEAVSWRQDAAVDNSSYSGTATIVPKGQEVTLNPTYSAVVADQEATTIRKQEFVLAPFLDAVSVSVGAFTSGTATVTSSGDILITYDRSLAGSSAILPVTLTAGAFTVTRNLLITSPVPQKPQAFTGVSTTMHTIVSKGAGSTWTGNVASLSAADSSFDLSSLTFSLSKLDSLPDLFLYSTFSIERSNDNTWSVSATLSFSGQVSNECLYVLRWSGNGITGQGALDIRYVYTPPASPVTVTGGFEKQVWLGMQQNTWIGLLHLTNMPLVPYTADVIFDSWSGPDAISSNDLEPISFARDGQLTSQSVGYGFPRGEGVYSGKIVLRFKESDRIVVSFFSFNITFPAGEELWIPAVRSYDRQVIGEYNTGVFGKDDSGPYPVFRSLATPLPANGTSADGHYTMQDGTLYLNSFTGPPQYRQGVMSFAEWWANRNFLFSEGIDIYRPPRKWANPSLPSETITPLSFLPTSINLTPNQNSLLFDLESLGGSVLSVRGFDIEALIGGKRVAITLATDDFDNVSYRYSNVSNLTLSTDGVRVFAKTACTFLSMDMTWTLLGRAVPVHVYAEAINQSILWHPAGLSSQNSALSLSARMGKLHLGDIYVDSRIVSQQWPLNRVTVVSGYERTTATLVPVSGTSDRYHVYGDVDLRSNGPTLIEVHGLSPTAFVARFSIACSDLRDEPPTTPLGLAWNPNGIVFTPDQKEEDVLVATLSNVSLTENDVRTLYLIATGLRLSRVEETSSGTWEVWARTEMGRYCELSVSGAPPIEGRVVLGNASHTYEINMRYSVNTWNAGFSAVTTDGTSQRQSIGGSLVDLYTGGHIVTIPVGDTSLVINSGTTDVRPIIRVDLKGPVSGITLPVRISVYRGGLMQADQTVNVSFDSMGHGTAFVQCSSSVMSSGLVPFDVVCRVSTAGGEFVVTGGANALVASFDVAETFNGLFEGEAVFGGIQLREFGAGVSLADASVNMIGSPWSLLGEGTIYGSGEVWCYDGGVTSESQKLFQSRRELSSVATTSSEYGVRDLRSGSVFATGEVTVRTDRQNQLTEIRSSGKALTLFRSASGFIDYGTSADGQSYDFDIVDGLLMSVTAEDPVYGNVVYRMTYTASRKLNTLKIENSSGVAVREFTYNYDPVTGLLTQIINGSGANATTWDIESQAGAYLRSQSVSSVATVKLQGELRGLDSIANNVYSGGQMSSTSITTEYSFDFRGDLVRRERWASNQSKSVVESWKRNSDGFVTEYTDQFNVKTSYKYQSDGPIWIPSQVWRAGALTSIDYGYRSILQRDVTDGTGAITRYGNASITYGDQSQETWTGTTLGSSMYRPLTHTSTLGLQETYNYNLGPANRFRANSHLDSIVQVDPNDSSASVTTSYQYYPSGRVWKITRSGTTTELLYDARGNVRHKVVTDSEYGVLLDEKYTYRADGLLTRVEDGRAYITEYVYDTRGLLIEKLEAKGTNEERKTTYTYYANGLMKEEKVVNLGSRGITKYFYAIDERKSWVVKMNVPGGQGTMVHAILTMETPDREIVTRDFLTGAVETKKLDRNGNFESIAKTIEGTSTAPSSRTSRNYFNYDANGRVIQEIDSKGWATRTWYDPMGQISGTLEFAASDTSVLGSWTQVARPNPQMTQTRTLVRNGVDGDQLLTSSSSLDAFGRFAGGSDAVGRNTNVVYRDGGRHSISTDFGGTVTKRWFDGLGRLRKQVNPDQSIATYNYDLSGNLSGEKVEKVSTGFVRESKITYDGLNRERIREISPFVITVPAVMIGALITQTTDYPTSGDWDRVLNDGQGTVTKQWFNALGMLGKQDVNGLQTDNTVAFAPTDLTRTVTSTTTLNGVVTNTSAETYGVSGLLLKRTVNGRVVVMNDYFVSGRVTSSTDSTGVVTSTAYPTHFQASVTSGDRTTVTDFDSEGRVTRVFDPNNKTTEYEYDGIGRKVSERAQIDFRALPASAGQNPSVSVIWAYRDWQYSGNTVVYNDRDGRNTTYTFDPVQNSRTESFTSPSETYTKTVWFNPDGSVDRAEDQQSIRVNGVMTPWSSSSVANAYHSTGQLDFVSRTVTTPSGTNSYKVDMSHGVGGDYSEELLPVVGSVPISLVTTAYDFDSLGRLASIVQTGTGANPVVRDKSVLFLYNSESQLEMIKRFESPNLTAGFRSFSEFVYNGTGQVKTIQHNLPNNKFIGNNVTYIGSRYNKITDFRSFPELGATNPRRIETQFEYHPDGRIDKWTSTTWMGVLGTQGTMQGVPVVRDLPDDTRPERRLFNDDKYNYFYDKEGHLIHKEGVTGSQRTDYEWERMDLVWDHEGRLLVTTSLNPTRDVPQANFQILEVTKSGTVSYHYDSMDKLVSRDSHVAESSKLKNQSTPPTVTQKENTVTTYYYDSNNNMLMTDVAAVAPNQNDDLENRPGALGRSVYLNGSASGRVLAIDGAPGIAWAYDDYQGNTVAWTLEGMIRLDTESQTGEIHESLIMNATTGASQTMDPFIAVNASDPAEVAGNVLNWAFVAPRFGGVTIDTANRLSIRDGSVYDPKSAQTVSGYQDVGVTGWTNLGRFFTGIDSVIPFQPLNRMLRWIGEETADRYQRGDWYYMGLGAGIVGTLGVGAAARGVGWGARLAYGYMVAGDVDAFAQSGYHLINGGFTPMHTLGFLPTVGWAMAGARRVTWVYAGAGISRSLGMAGDALPVSVPVNSPMWRSLRSMISSDDALQVNMGGRMRGPSVVLGKPSELIFDPLLNQYDINLQTFFDGRHEMVNLGVLAEEIRHALDQVGGIHPGRDAIEEMIYLTQAKLRTPNRGVAVDVVVDMWHVGVFGRLSRDLQDANSFFRRSGFWISSDSEAFYRLSLELRNDSSRVPTQLLPWLEAFNGQ